ncbi:hypothetical protein A8L34_27870 [Bacillus sp. FJAT-27264]|uniref:hypothetical protein n=1 Tax=Paenibacillus sp. (strain DSM 101736 / FJAT-27264) TaxID=1850362 RepID=UPI000807B9E9|nr:hypothetical protein [Bacillus sp. FJAT-27264]OBZ15867.1 hypothetical protein A8L34_27870 [Bacillus sp. FJAT-27264]
MKDLFERAYGTYYTATGKVDPMGDWALEATTPREILLQIIAGEKAPRKFLIEKESQETYFAEDLPVCDKVRMLFEEKGIILSLLQVIDIWNQHSEDLFATWLGWDSTSFNELNAIYLELISGARSSCYKDSPWEEK